MRLILKSLVFFTMLASLMSIPVSASNPLNKETVEKLVTGNTAEVQNSKWKQKQASWYFSTSGQIKSLDKNKKSGKGKWHVNDNGELCIQFKRQDNEHCRTVVPTSDGGYELYGTRHPFQGDLMWIIKEVSPGNVHDL